MNLPHAVTYLDTETSGLDPKTSALFEVGLIRVAPGVDVDIEELRDVIQGSATAVVEGESWSRAEESDPVDVHVLSFAIAPYRDDVFFDAGAARVNRYWERASRVPGLVHVHNTPRLPRLTSQVISTARELSVSYYEGSMSVAVIRPEAYLAGPLAADLVMAMTSNCVLAGAVIDFDAKHLTDLTRRMLASDPAWHYHLLDVETYAAGALGDPVSKGTTITKALNEALDEEAVQIPTDEGHTALADALWAMEMHYAARRVTNS